MCVCAHRSTRPSEEDRESTQSTAAAAVANPPAGPAEQSSDDTLMHHLTLALASAQQNFSSFEPITLATDDIVVSAVRNRADNAVQRQSTDRQPSPANQPAARRSFVPISEPSAADARSMRLLEYQQVSDSLFARAAAIRARTASRPLLHLSPADPPAAGGPLATALPGRVDPSNGGGRGGGMVSLRRLQHGAGDSTAAAARQPLPSQPVLSSLGPQSPGSGLPPSTSAARGSRPTPRGSSAQPQPQPVHMNSREFPELSETNMTRLRAAAAAAAAATRRVQWYSNVFHCIKCHSLVHAQAVSFVLMCLLMGLTVLKPYRPLHSASALSHTLAKAAYTPQHTGRQCGTATFKY